ncbi:MAG: FG-GAP repeat domain-containing protein [Gemmataceae bacterium]
MKTSTLSFITLFAGFIGAAQGQELGCQFPTFRIKEVEKSLGVGYAVRIADVNNDKKQDIVVVDRRRVVWYENPSWKRRTIIQDATKPDNVCIAVHDIDGDGKVDFALGAGWNSGTKKSAPIYWLKRKDSLEQSWDVHPIGEEPSVHRMQFIDLHGTGTKQLVVVPLQGRNCTSKKNWTDGQPVRIIAYTIPEDPTSDRWRATILDQSLYVVHNFCRVPVKTNGSALLTASYLGLHIVNPKDTDAKSATPLHPANQENPNGSRGASEIAAGNHKKNRFLATIEPWHGNQVVVYTQIQTGPKRRVIDDRLQQGHAVACVDVDGAGIDEIIVGSRDDFDENNKQGVRLYKAGTKYDGHWTRHVMDHGGIAVEDLVVGDLNNDGKPEIVAVGRRTHNMRIYWNQGNKK